MYIFDLEYLNNQQTNLFLHKIKPKNSAKIMPICFILMNKTGSLKDIMENTELKNKVPGQKTMFNFEDDKGFDISEKLKSDLSSMLDIEFIDEANLCLRFMNELYEEYLNE